MQIKQLLRHTFMPILALAATLLFSTGAQAVCTGQFNGGEVCGNNNTTIANPGPTANPVLGVPGTTPGSVTLSGATSGQVTIVPQATAGSATLMLPNTNGTLPSAATAPITLNSTTGNIGCATCLTTTGSFANPTAQVGLSTVNGTATTAMRSDGAPSLDQSISPTWTGTHTFTNSKFRLLGSSTGYSTFTSANAGASNFTLTFPAVTDTLAALGTAQTWTALQKYTNGDLGLLGSSTGYTLLESGLSGVGNNTLTLPTTSSDTLAALGTTQTWSALQQYNDGDFALKGATSGTLVQHAASTAGSSVLTWPAGTTDFSATGATHNVIRQSSAGAALTVGQLACSDLSDASLGCAGGISALTGDVTATGPGSVAATLATAQPNAHTWAATQTFTLAPVFTDQAGTRTALGLGTFATQNYATPPAIGGTTPNTGAFSNVSVFGTGEVLEFGIPSGTRTTIINGTTASPVTALNAPSVVISRVEALPSAGGAQSSALYVFSDGTAASNSQNQAITALAQNSGAADAVAVFGDAVQNVATHYAYGAYFQATAATQINAFAIGNEVRADNNTGGDQAYAYNGVPGITGAHIFTLGANKAVAGVWVGQIGGTTQFDIGLLFTPGALAIASIQDDSSSTTILRATGAHTTAFDISGATCTDLIKGPSSAFKATCAGSVNAANAYYTSAAPTVATAQVGFGSTVAANTNCGTLAGSAGCLVINVAGTTRYTPYY